MKQQEILRDKPVDGTERIEKAKQEAFRKDGVVKLVEDLLTTSLTTDSDEAFENVQQAILPD